MDIKILPKFQEQEQEPKEEVRIQMVQRPKLLPVGSVVNMPSGAKYEITRQGWKRL